MPNPTTITGLVQSRAVMIAAGFLAYFGTLIGLCGNNSPACIAVIFLDGAIALLWIASACALGTVILRRSTGGTNFALFIASAGALGMGMYSLIALGLGLAGLLNHATAIAFPIISITAFLADLFRLKGLSKPLLRYAEEPGQTFKRNSTIESWLRAPAATSNWIWLIPIISLSIACVSASIMPGVLWKPLDPHPYDVTSYHLLVPREWYELGKIVPLTHNVFSFFPFNVEMQSLLLMHVMGGPWAAMYACQFVSVGYAALMVLGVCGASAGVKAEHRTSNTEHRTSKKEHPTDLSESSSLQSSPFDVRRSTFAFSSALVATVPWVIMLAGVAYVESALMLYTALAIAWAMRAIQSQDRFYRHLILAGVMAGFAAGVKITAVPMLLLAVPVAVGVALLQQRISAKTIVLGSMIFLGAGVLLLSPWLVRNYFWAGNPIFPLGMKLLGQAHFTNEQVLRFVTAHSPTSTQQTVLSRLNILWNSVLGHWQYGFVLLPASIVAGAMCWRSGSVRLLMICGLFILVTWIGFTHLLPRFLVMLIPVSAIMVGQLRVGRAWPICAILVIASAGLGFSRVIGELYPQSNPGLFMGKPRPALIGLSPDFMMSQELIDARDSHQQIGMIGDAQAFLYQIPMSQLHYKSVFDVDGKNPVDAWMGHQVVGDRNWLLVINPMEIDRLHGTYRGIPALPPSWAARPPETFYERGDQVLGTIH